MMLRKHIIIAGALVVAAIASGTTLASLLKRGASGSSAPAAYAGPGDITSFTAYWGLRAYTAAIAAAGTQPLITLKKTANSHTCDLLVATNGGIGLTGNCSTGSDNGQTGLFFCTSTAGGTGSISGTTLTASAGTFNNFDIIYGAGIVLGTEIIAVGGGGTYTVTPSQNVGSVAITTTDCYPTTFYDQTSNNACTASSCNLTANTRGGAGQPDRIYFVFNCFGTQPCLSSAGDDTFFATALGVGNRITPATGVVSMMAETQRLASDGSSLVAQVVAENSDTQNYLAFLGAGILKAKVQGGVLSSSVSSNTYSDSPTKFHSMIGVVGSGTNNSSITMDGNTVVGTATGSTVIGHPNLISGYGPQITQASEAGFIDNVAWNSTTVTNLYANQAAYWGSP